MESSKDWTEIQTIDVHTCGEPLRIIISGFPKLKGKTLLEKRTHAKNNFDQLRKAIMWEPRGHADMYGAIIVSPDTLMQILGLFSFIMRDILQAVGMQ